MNEAPDPNDNPYPQPGEVLEGKYEIQRVLGTGAMGAVVRATHLLRQAPVALKFMSPQVMNRPGIVRRFLNEGVAASQIDSDHAVKVLDVCELDTGVPYLVMEYLEGEDLKEMLEREGNPGLDDIPRAVHITLQILRGLQVAHRAEIVHRDMKPANVFLVTKDGAPDFVKIVDFGISKIRQPDQIELTNVGSALGTPLYMSPEQARNPKDVDPRSDLYAVAAILYEMIAGQPPFVPESGTLSELMIKLGTEEPASLEETRSNLPVGFWATVARGLAKLPEQRYQSAKEFAEALAPFADERSSHVLKQMASRTLAGVSRMPPAPGPPTHVDDDPAGRGSRRRRARCSCRSRSCRCPTARRWRAASTVRSRRPFLPAGSTPSPTPSRARFRTPRRRRTGASPCCSWCSRRRRWRGPWRLRSSWRGRGRRRSRRVRRLRSRRIPSRLRLPSPRPSLRR